MKDLSSLVPGTLGSVFAWMGEHSTTPSGPPFLRYNATACIDGVPHAEIDACVPVSSHLSIPSDASVQMGSLPSGRYATLLFRGHYSGLGEATKQLHAWVASAGAAAKEEQRGEWTHWEAWVEISLNNPNDVPDPALWETEIAILVQ